MIKRILRITGWLVLFFLAIYLTRDVFIKSYYLIGDRFGLLEDQVAIAGTGSMYPTFPKGTKKDPVSQAREIVGTSGMLPYPNGIEFRGKRYFGHEIGRGDIVTFENARTRKSTKERYGRVAGLMKRVIAMPGDRIELRDGLVYLNKKVLDEPYIARARSTFGGEFLADCREIAVPGGHLFVMGDNRKASGDSRHEIELVAYEDIDHVLPLSKQVGSLDKNWRDTSRDKDEASAIQLDAGEYLKLLNARRQAAGVKPLRYEPKLEASAHLRATKILEHNDYSFEATRSGYTMKAALNEAGYSNIVYGELPVPGHYEAAELIESQWEFPETVKFLVDPDYQEIGIADVNMLVNGCATNTVVLHIAGYVPPNYEQSTINSWKEVLVNLRDISPSWNRIREFGEFYEKNKTDVDRINTIISERISNIEGIVTSMERNEWLNDSQIEYTKRDANLAREQAELAKKLNTK